MFSWRSRAGVKPPPLINVTHAKAGSTWIDKILRQLYGAHVSPRLWAPPARFDFEQYRVYPALFMTWEKFRSYPELLGVHRFLVIRDLRDTLVSDYFSLRDTHDLDPTGIIAKRREKLRSCSEEEGLAHLIDEVLHLHADIQRSWLEAEVITLRYEDLLRDDLAILRRMLLGTFGHAIPERQFERAVVSSRFENVFRRKLGTEDPRSHGRKGEPGDWRNHLTPKLRQQFDARYGDLLIATGYEKDRSWVTLSE